MNLRDQLALMKRGDQKDIYHNNVLIQAVFDYSGVFALAVAEPDTLKPITNFSHTSLKECLEFLQQF